MISGKPPAKMERRDERVGVAESRVPYSMKLKPSEIEAVKTRALRKGIGHTTLAREYLLTGMTVDDVDELRKGHIRVTA